MTRVVDKYLNWFQSIYIKRFNSIKSIYLYMYNTENQNWKKVDLDSLSDKVLSVFGWRDRDAIEEFHEFYENSLGEHIQINKDIDGILFSISLQEYINRYNLSDSDSTPILTNFFKRYINTSEALKQLNENTVKAIGFDNVSKKTDLKIMNTWAIEQIETQMRPAYYEPQIYAYLIIIVGNMLLNTKLKNYYWRVAKTRSSVYDNGVTNQEFYFAPYICSEEGVVLDIVQAFREYLFLGCGNRKKIFTSIYDNIEKYSLTYYDFIEKQLSNEDFR